MKLYIYRNLKKNYIKLLENVMKSEEVDENFELLFIIESTLSKVYLDLRAYQILYLLPNIVFRWCSDVDTYFRYSKYNCPSELLETTDAKLSEKILNDFKSDYEKLKEIGLVAKIIPDTNLYLSEPGFKYVCDIYNYLSDLYTEKIVSFITNFQSLGKQKKNFILEINKFSTRDRKLKFINENLSSICGDDVEEVLSYLPEWYRLSYKVSGQQADMETRESSNQIEYSNTGNLGKDDIQLQKELYAKLRDTIYQTFDIGKTYSGSYILSKLRDIYKSLDIQKTAKIKDVYEFFEYKKVNLRYHISEYKLVTRKIN